MNGLSQSNIAYLCNMKISRAIEDFIAELEGFDPPIVVEMDDKEYTVNLRHRFAAPDIENLSEELKDVINLNIHEDGDLDEYDVPDFFKQETQKESEDDEEPEYDLELDMGQDDEAYSKMEVSRPTWPQHDWSVTWQPAGINRYMVDYLRLVADTMCRMANSCNSCNATNPEEARFCQKCGKKLTVTPVLEGTYIEFDVVNGVPTPFPEGVDPSKIKQVWFTFPFYKSGDRPETNVNAWPEDKGHDWNIHNGLFRYVTRQIERGEPARLVLEMNT